MSNLTRKEAALLILTKVKKVRGIKTIHKMSTMYTKVVPKTKKFVDSLSTEDRKIHRALMDIAKHKYSELKKVIL